MTPYPKKHRIEGIQLAEVRINMLGGMGTFAKYALVDEEARPMAFVMSQKFSPRTEKLFQALQQSLEQDAHDIYLDARGEWNARGEWDGAEPEENEPVSFE